MLGGECVEAKAKLARKLLPYIGGCRESINFWGDSTLKKCYVLMVIILLVFTGVIGCSNQSGLTGKWTPEIAGEGADWEFFSDGTCVLDEYGGTYTAEKGRLRIDMGYEGAHTFNYSINGGKLTLADDEGNSIVLVRAKN